MLHPTGQTKCINRNPLYFWFSNSSGSFKLELNINVFCFFDWTKITVSFCVNFILLCWVLKKLYPSKDNYTHLELNVCTSRHFPFTSISRPFLTNFLSQFFKAWKTSTHRSEPSSFVNCRRKKYNTSLKSLWIGGAY